MVHFVFFLWNVAFILHKSIRNTKYYDKCNLLRSFATKNILFYCCRRQNNRFDHISKSSWNEKCISSNNIQQITFSLHIILLYFGKNVLALTMVTLDAVQTLTLMIETKELYLKFSRIDIQSIYTPLHLIRLNIEILCKNRGQAT